MADTHAMAEIRKLPIDDQQLTIVDALLPEPRVAEVHAFCRGLPYHRIRYGYRDDPAAELSYGHQWVHGITPEERAQLPLAEMEDTVRALFPDEKLSPGRAHVSCIQSGDTRFAHIDDATGRVITAVYFANSVWERDWTGELVFYQGGEPLYSVFPRPGRVIVFDGRLVHRGGVPAATAPDVRYAIAAKFMRS